MSSGTILLQVPKLSLLRFVSDVFLVFTRTDTFEILLDVIQTQKITRGGYMVRDVTIDLLYKPSFVLSVFKKKRQYPEYKFTPLVSYLDCSFQPYHPIFRTSRFFFLFRPFSLPIILPHTTNKTHPSGFFRRDFSTVNSLLHFTPLLVSL